MKIESKKFSFFYNFSFVFPLTMLPNRREIVENPSSHHNGKKTVGKKLFNSILGTFFHGRFVQNISRNFKVAKLSRSQSAGTFFLCISSDHLQWSHGR